MIRPKTFDVTVAVEEVPKKAEQTVEVTGLAPEEELTVMYAGEKLTTGTADADGKFTYTFGVGNKAGEKTVKVIGMLPQRSGETTFTVMKPDPNGPQTGRWSLGLL